MTEDHAEQPARPPMAWGQLVVGAVIGGITLWSIALHISGVAPSTLLAGVAATYQGWRDWLLMPLLAQFDVALAPLDRDIVAYVTVMTGAWVRTAMRYPEAWGGLFDLFLFPSALTVLVYYWVPERWSPSFGVSFWFTLAAIVCSMRLLIRPLTGLAASYLVDEHTAAHLGELNTPVVRFGFWNALAVFVFGIGLLALDSAMR